MFKNFEYEDFFVSDTAKKHGLDLMELKNQEIDHNIQFIIGPKVQEARDIVKSPLFINSCFRPAELNKLIPGSSKTSAHLKALGADIYSKTMSEEELFDRLVAHPTFMLSVDQLIIERGCVHIGMVAKKHSIPRRELRELIKNGNKYEYRLLRIWTSPNM